MMDFSKAQQKLKTIKIKKVEGGYIWELFMWPSNNPTCQSPKPYPEIGELRRRLLAFTKHLTGTVEIQDTFPKRKSRAL